VCALHEHAVHTLCELYKNFKNTDLIFGAIKEVFKFSVGIAVGKPLATEGCSKGIPSGKVSYRQVGEAG
jgi:hypothetical protein